MKVQEAYNIWANQYDTNLNKTRDLEAVSLRETLKNISFNSCLEIGCGTGKNTEWLLQKATRVRAVDLADEMLAKAKNKIKSDKVVFIKADINEEWNFTQTEQYDLVTFSLVLEHIENLHHIFKNLAKTVTNNGYVYIGELHPFKQYTGSKARFETEEGLHIVPCFNHHISDFTNYAKKYDFDIIDVKEYFDDDDKKTLPRILTLLLQHRL